MLRGIDCGSWSRALAWAASLSVLGACDATGEVAPGQVEVSVSGLCGGARDGQLRLDGATSIVVPGSALCQGSLVRELPAGSYSLSWQGGAYDGATPPTPPEWQGPALLSVLAGRTTQLHMTVEALPSPAISEASAGDAHAAPSATCGYVADRVGPS